MFAFARRTPSCFRKMLLFSSSASFVMINKSSEQGKEQDKSQKLTPSPIPPKKDLFTLVNEASWGNKRLFFQKHLKELTSNIDKLSTVSIANGIIFYDEFAEAFVKYLLDH